MKMELLKHPLNTADDPLDGNAWCLNLMHNAQRRSIETMKYFITFALICIAAIAGTKLVFMLFNLGEMGWEYFVLPIAFYYVGAYGFPFLKSKGKK